MLLPIWSSMVKGDNLLPRRGHYPHIIYNDKKDTLLQYLIKKTQNLLLLMLYFLLSHTTIYIQIHADCSVFSGISIAYWSGMQLAKSIKHFKPFYMFDVNYHHFIFMCVLGQKMICDVLCFYSYLCFHDVLGYLKRG